MRLVLCALFFLWGRLAAAATRSCPDPRRELVPVADPNVMGLAAYEELFPPPSELNAEGKYPVVFQNEAGVDLQIRWVRSHENEVLLPSKYLRSPYLAFCQQAFRVYSKEDKSLLAEYVVGDCDDKKTTRTVRIEQCDASFSEPQHYIRPIRKIPSYTRETWHKINLRRKDEFPVHVRGWLSTDEVAKFSAEAMDARHGSEQVVMFQYSDTMCPRNDKEGALSPGELDVRLHPVGNTTVTVSDIVHGRIAEKFPKEEGDQYQIKISPDDPVLRASPEFMSYFTGTLKMREKLRTLHSDLCFGEEEEYIPAPTIRLTPPGYFTYPFHFDCIEVWLHQLLGRKRILLIDPKYVKRTTAEIGDFQTQFHCEGDPVAVNHTCLASSDEERTCSRRGVVWEAVLEPGDALWLPLQWQHAIETIGSNSSFGISQPFLLYPSRDTSQNYHQDCYQCAMAFDRFYPRQTVMLGQENLVHKD